MKLQAATTASPWTQVYCAWVVAGVMPEGLRPCTQGVPCSEAQIRRLGVQTIPLLSLMAFTLLVALLWRARARSSR